MIGRMLRRLFFPSVLIGLLLGGVGSAQAALMLSDDPAYIEYAARAEFESVLSVQFRDGAGNPMSRRGTAVLFHEEFVITAAHVLDASYGSALVGTGQNTRTDPGELREISQVWFHPSYVSGSAVGNSVDLAVAKLWSPLAGITPAQFATNMAQVGDIVSLVGYGTPRLPTGPLPNDYWARGGQNIVDRNGWNTFGIRSDYSLLDFGPLSGTPTLPNELGVTGGDSGGGMFGSDGTLYGSLTFQFGDYRWSGAQNIAPHAAWAYDIRDANMSAVPEPSSIFLVGFGSLLLLWRRR